MSLNLDKSESAPQKLVDRVQPEARGGLSEDGSPFWQEVFWRRPRPSEARRLNSINRRLQIRGSGQPAYIWQLQTDWEVERLLVQLSRHWRTDGQTSIFSFDPRLDLMANAENNVRALWVEQGIWNVHWGPAWSPGSCPLDFEWLLQQVYPIARPLPNQSWQRRHRRPADEKCLESIRSLFDSREAREHWENLPGQTFDASRPANLFLFQVLREYRWIQDEAGTNRSAKVDKEKAFEIVKQRWIEGKVWQDYWKELPGMSWPHEERDGYESSDMFEDEVRRTWAPFPGPVAESKALCMEFPRVYDAIPDWLRPGSGTTDNAKFIAPRRSARLQEKENQEVLQKIKSKELSNEWYRSRSFLRWPPTKGAIPVPKKKVGKRGIERYTP